METSIPATDTPMSAPTSMGFAARAEGAVKIFGSHETQVRALDGVTVDFQKGQFTSIMGPSGSGKSTLMHCLAGLDTLSGGSTFIGDVRLQSLSEKQLTLLRRDNIGFIFQAFNLLPTLNARENITLPQNLAGKNPNASWMEEVVTAVGLGDRMHHRPTELSGGQQQRVAVARALASQPEIILADEPTGNLDSRSGGEVLQFLRDAVDKYHQTIVMVTHDPNAASYSDRVIFLKDGKIADEVSNPSLDTIVNTIKNLSD